MNDSTDPLDRYRDLVDDWQALQEACARPLPVVVWQNPLRDRQTAILAGHAGLPARATVADLLATRGYELTPLSWTRRAWRVHGLDKPGRTIEHYLGLMHVQEEVSLVPPIVLGAQPGERVLDLCAAPGGKSAGIAIGMGNRGTLVANDIRPQRLRSLRSNCERLGILNVVVTPIDGVKFPLSSGPFDRILLDVPCSCEGNVRGSRSTRRSSPGTAILGRGGLQATLIGRAWKLLRPGGTLVYSTCTFAPEENEVVLDHALGEDATIEPYAVPGLTHAPGVTEWGGKSLRRDCQHLGRYWPHLNDTGGFTVARIRKAAA